MLFSSIFLFSNCAHIVQTREEYAVVGEEPNINGARLSAELLTTQGKVNYSLSAMVYFAAGEAATGRAQDRRHSERQERPAANEGNTT